MEPYFIQGCGADFWHRSSWRHASLKSTYIVKLFTLIVLWLIAIANDNAIQFTQNDFLWIHRIPN